MVRQPRAASTKSSTPSSSGRCRTWETSMIPLRAAMPITVTKPTSEPSESTPPVSATPPSRLARDEEALLAARKRVLAMMKD